MKDLPALLTIILTFGSIFLCTAKNENVSPQDLTKHIKNEISFLCGESDSTCLRVLPSDSNNMDLS
jgi:hypothetical protein